MTTLAYIWKNLDHFKARFVLNFIIAFLGGVFTFLFLIVVTEFLKTQASTDLFWYLLIGLTTIYTTNLALSYIVRSNGEPFAQQFSDYLRLKLFQKLELLDPHQLKQQHSGYIYALSNNVATGITPIIMDLLWVFSIAIAQLILYFIYIGMESPMIAILNAIIFGIFIVVSIKISQKMAVLAKNMNIKQAEYTKQTVDFMTNILTIRQLGIHQFAKRKLNTQRAKTYQQATINARAHANRWLLLHSIYGIAFIGTISFFIYFVSIGKLSPALLILFVAALQRIKGSIERVSESAKNIIEMNTYIDSLEKILSQTMTPSNGKRIKKWENIKLHNIQYQHPNSSKTIKIPNLTIQKKDKICIEGKSGEGKSTMLSLIMNFLPAQKGTYRIDGKNIQTIEKSFFQNTFALVSQEAELFDLTLEENLTLGKKISPQKIVRLLQEVDLADWYKGLEKGLATNLGEKGVRLSAGQKQRINLVRALLMDKEIYLLDEPTAHLDHQTEQIIIKFLKKHLKEKTIIVATHKEPIKKICTHFYKVRKHQLETMTQ